MGELKVPCGQCGAALKVDEGVEWVSCAGCSTMLQVVRKGEAIYTRPIAGPALDPDGSDSDGDKGGSARGTSRSFERRSGTRWIKYGLLPGLAVYILCIGLTFELMTGTRMAWGVGTNWIYLLLMVPFVAPLLSAILLLPVWGLLKFVKPFRHAIPASLLIAAGCAALAVAQTYFAGQAALAEAGSEMLAVLRQGGYAVWADYVGALIFVGQQVFLLLVSLGCTIGGGIALVSSLVGDPSDRPAGWVLGASGLAGVGALAGLVVFTLGLLANLPLVSAIRQTEAADPADRKAAVEALGELGDLRGRVYLFERLTEDDDAQVRIAAAAALGDQVGPRSSSRLVKLLPEQDPRLVQAGLDALRAIQARAGLDDRQRQKWSHELSKLLRAEQAPIRRKAADLLIAMGPTCTSTVRGMLSREGETRALAIEILGAVGDENAIGGLIYQLDQPGAIEALGKVTERVGVALLIQQSFSRSAPAWYRIKEPITKLVLQMGDGALDQLKGAACDMKMRAEGRKFARKLVSDIGGDEALAATVHCVLPLLSAESSRDRDIGRYELYRIGKGAVGPLIEAMQGMDERSREGAGKALRKLTRKRFGPDAAKWMEWWQKVQGTGAWK